MLVVLCCLFWCQSFGDVSPLIRVFILCENNGGTVNDLQLSRKGMNIGFLNVQGLCSRDMAKFSEIELMMTSERNKNLTILSLCETKLKDNKLTNFFHVNGYHSPFRKDKYTNAGGGILVYVRNNIIAKRRLDLETNDIACLWLEIIPEKGKSFLVGSCIGIRPKG